MPAIIPAILKLAQLAPAILPLFSRDEQAGRTAETVARVARAVTGTDSPDAAEVALRADPQALIAFQNALNAHALALTQEDNRRLETINATIRAEIASGDWYVRRMRPTFGYIMALSWAAQMGAIAWSVVAEPASAGTIIAAMANLGTIWSVGLAVLGIYVYRRSSEKMTDPATEAPSAPLAGLATLLRGRS